MAIENNSLSLEQVKDIIVGKRILGAANEICEVKNAFEPNNKLLEMNPYSINDMLLAHKVLMNELTNESGTFGNNYLLPALELGYVEMTIPDKPNSSK